MDLVSAATQGVFSIVVAAFLIWDNAKQKQRTDTRINELDAYVRSLEKYCRDELSSLVTDCTSVLTDVREFLKSREAK
jgi:hypothetical protein